MRPAHAPERPDAAPTADDATRRALVHAAAAVASAGEDDIFEVLVLGAARALGADLALIGVLAEGQADRIRTIAVCDRGRSPPTSSTPCAGLPASTW
jgi:hypothetical protein